MHVFNVGNRVILKDNAYYLDKGYDERFAPGTAGTVVEHSNGEFYVSVLLDTYPQKALVFIPEELEFMLQLNYPAVNTGD